MTGFLESSGTDLAQEFANMIVYQRGYQANTRIVTVTDSMLEELVFTDSIPYSNRCAKVRQLSIADMFAETIRRVMANESISSQYIMP